MKTTHTGVWHKLRAGDYAMSVWQGDTQLTYRAMRGRGGWVVVRTVSGAGRTTTLGEPYRTLREAKAAVLADWATGLV